MRRAIVDAESVIYGGGQGSDVARGLHIDFGIADQHCFAGSGAEFAKDGVCAERIGLFCFKAVAAIDGAEIFRQAEPFQYAHADPHRFVRQDSHGESREMFEHFGDARIRARRIHFVIFVVREEKFQRSLAFRFRGVFAQGPADELRRAMADVAGDGVFVQLLAAQFLQHGVHRVDQVALGIDERAVQIEDQRANRREIRGGHGPAIVI